MIAVDINSSIIRVVEVDGGKVLSWSSHPVEPGIFDDGMIENPQGLGKIIKDIFDSNKIRNKRVTAGIYGLYSLNRILIVPTPPAVQLTTNTVIESVENVLPVAEEEIYLSWEPISAVEGGQQVIIHAIPRDIMDDAIQALKTAGLSAQMVDITPMALARAVNNDEGLILNIENESMDVIMIVDGLAEVIRTSWWKQEDMSVEEKAEYLASAVDMTVSFFDSTRPGFPFRRTNPLYITGEMSADTELVNKIREYLEYTEGTFNIPFEYPEHFPVSEYASTIGLAMKGMGVADGLYSGYLTPDINLLPQKYKPWRPTAKQTYAGLAFIIALVALLPFFRTTFDAIDETDSLRLRYNAVNQLLIMRQAELSKREPLKQVTDEWVTINSMGNGFVEDYLMITGLADELNITLSPINHSGSSIGFSCSADDYKIFRQFISTLEGNERFHILSTPPEGYPYYTSGNIQLQINS